MTLVAISLLPVLVFMGMYFNKKTVELQKENNKKENKVYGIF
jgi:hypothetical protein